MFANVLFTDFAKACAKSEDIPIVTDDTAGQFKSDPPTCLSSQSASEFTNINCAKLLNCNKRARSQPGWAEGTTAREQTVSCSDQHGVAAIAQDRQTYTVEAELDTKGQDSYNSDGDGCVSDTQGTSEMDHALPAQEMHDDDSPTGHVHDDPAPKRGRGRPRKKQRGLFGRFPKVEDGDDAPTRRGRGRPRKTAATVPCSSTQDTRETEVANKAGRGRARKVRRGGGSGLTCSHADANAQDASDDSDTDIAPNNVEMPDRPTLESLLGFEAEVKHTVSQMLGPSVDLSALMTRHTVEGTEIDGVPDSGRPSVTGFINDVLADAPSGDESGGFPDKQGHSHSQPWRGQARPRGRPRGSGGTNLVRNAEGQLVRRGRGRPRKDECLSRPRAAGTATVTADSDERGASSAGTQDDAASEDNQLEFGADIEDLQRKRGRPRGRPPKKKGGRPRLYPAGSEGELLQKAKQQEKRRKRALQQREARTIGSSANGGLGPALRAPSSLFPYGHGLSDPRGLLSFADSCMIPSSMHTGGCTPNASAMAANAFVAALLAAAQPHVDMYQALASPIYNLNMPYPQMAMHHRCMQMASGNLFGLHPELHDHSYPPRDPHGLLQTVAELLNDD